MAKKIAIVEDDPDQRLNYSDAIAKKGTRYPLIQIGRKRSKPLIQSYRI